MSTGIYITTDVGVKATTSRPTAIALKDAHRYLDRCVGGRCEVGMVTSAHCNHLSARTKPFFAKDTNRDHLIRGDLAPHTTLQGDSQHGNV